MNNRKIEYADDDTESIWCLMRLRFPSLAIGLVFGIALSFATSRFEEVLRMHVALVFFIPLVVYLGAAIGAQTQSIYARDLRTGKASFKTYFIKETGVGLIFGLIFGTLIYLIVSYWFQSSDLAKAVGLSVFAIISFAPLVALTVTEIFQLEHLDPAVGAGPIGTVIQDTISILLFGLITTALLL